MNKKKLKKLALKGVCGGLMFSAPALIASQNADALATFTANSSGQAHANYLAGSCGGGSCGGGGGANAGGKSMARNQPQSSCGGGHANNLTAYEYTCSHAAAAQWNQYADQYSHSQGSCGQGQQHQPSYHYNQYNQSQGSCGQGQQQWNQSSYGSNQGGHANFSDMQRNARSYTDNAGNQNDYNNPNNQYNQQYRQQQQQARPGQGGQVAISEIPGAIDNTVQNRMNNTNPYNNQQQIQNDQNRLQNQRAGQSGWQGQQNAPRIQGQLATGMVADSKKLTESEFKSVLNPQAKADYDALSPSGKALALKMANQTCSHKNDCKGQNSCKSKTNSCAGNGGCKGTAETNFKDKNLAVKAAKMAEKRGEATNPANTR